MRTIRALVRAAWLTAMSYRVRAIMGLLSLWVTVIPVYYVATAMQPLMARSIANEGAQYFPFVLLGFGVTGLLGATGSALPGAVQSGIGSGFFESLAMTRARPGAVLLGLSLYPILWGVLRLTLLIAAGWVMGAHVRWAGAPAAAIILAILLLAHWGIGLIATALVVAYRTSGPLLPAVLVGSNLLGGAYYSASVVPAGMQWASALFPATYGLRALRQVLLEGRALSSVAGDVSILMVMATLLLGAGAAAYRRAMHYARRTGSLSHS